MLIYELGMLHSFNIQRSKFPIHCSLSIFIFNIYHLTFNIQHFLFTVHCSLFIIHFSFSTFNICYSLTNLPLRPLHHPQQLFCNIIRGYVFGFCFKVHQNPMPQYRVSHCMNILHDYCKSSLEQCPCFSG